MESSTEDNVLSADDSAFFCPDEDEMYSASCPSLEVEENAPTTPSTSRPPNPGVNPKLAAKRRKPRIWMQKIKCLKNLERKSLP